MQRILSKNQIRKARRYRREQYRAILSDLATRSPRTFKKEVAASLVTPRHAHSIGNILSGMAPGEARYVCESVLAEVVAKMQQKRDARNRRKRR